MTLPEKDGTIGAVEILRPLYDQLDAEVLREPKWTAGKKDGKPVRVYFIMPIRLIQQ